MKIYIIRHGQTALNKEAVLQGRSDYPLNEKGIDQAEAAREALQSAGVRFDKVYTSPLIRAGQTAEIVAGPEVPMVKDDRLIEMDYGQYEGADLKNMPMELQVFFSDFVNNPAPEGMEPLASVVERMGDFLEEVRRRDSDCENILLSTHAIAMKGALEYLMPDSQGRWWSTFIGNCAVYVVEAGEDGFFIPEEFKQEKL